MITESNVKLNVSKMNVLKDVFAKQKDSNSRFLNCVFFDGDGRKFIPVRQGDVVINAERSDGLYHSFVGSINDDGSVRVPLTNWMLDKAGILVCSVTIYEGTEKLTTAAFQIFVEKAENPDGAISPDDPSTDVAQQLVLRAEAAASEAVKAAEEMETRFADAGIHGESYETIFDTATITTEIHSNKQYPWVKLSSTTDMIKPANVYRVTFDGNEYVFPSQMWFSDSLDGKNNELVGDASLWGNIQGFTHTIYNAPFLVSDLMCDGDTNTEGLYLFTSLAGEHTIKIERVIYDYTELPSLLVNGKAHPLGVILTGTHSYPSYSIGDNIIKNLRGVFAIGYQNLILNQMSFAFGGSNTIEGDGSYAFGLSNYVGGNHSVGIGKQNRTFAPWAKAIGYGCDVNGRYGTAIGTIAKADGMLSTAIGYGTIANRFAQYAMGCYNEEDPSTVSGIMERGLYVEMVGNGTGENARSNARTLDWSGNEALAGSITLGKGTADEVTLTAAQLKQLLAMLS